MNKSVVMTVGGLIVGALAAVIYFTLLAPAPADPCRGEKHCIPVYVIIVDGKAKIQDIADHEVREQGAVITWRIGTDNYNLPNNGIAFDKPGNPPGTSAEFIDCHTAGEKKFVCTDRHNTLNKFG